MNADPLLDQINSLIRDAENDQTLIGILSNRINERAHCLRAAQAELFALQAQFPKPPEIHAPPFRNAAPYEF